MKRLALFFTFSIFYFISNTSATEYYVDYSNGNDSNSGIVQNSPFQHCPGDPNASDNAANVVLSPGDIVTFKAGVEYKGQVIISNSGTTDNFITYMGSVTWGVGKAIFEMEYSRSKAFAGVRNYIRIENIEFLHWTGGGSGVVDIGSHSIVNNCEFGYVQGWAQNRTKGELFHLDGVADVSITNCEFWAVGYYAVKLYDVDGVYIQNNDFGGINRGSDKGYFSTAIAIRNTARNVHIEDNNFHDGWQYGGDVNPELTHSPNWVHGYGNSAGTIHPSNIYIERNFFYNDHQFNTGTGSDFIGLGYSLEYAYIRNNIFVNACQWWGAQVMFAGGADYIWVENNTFVNRDYLNPSTVYGLKVYLSGTGQAAGDNIYIYNNIFYNDDEKTGSICIEFAGGGTFGGECDYNSYYTIHGNEDIVGYSGLKNLGEMQALGFDTHSIFEINGSDIFNYFPSFPENSSGGDYSLNPGFASNQIDHGLTRNGYSDSFDGTQRPQGQAWDMGAYEIQTGPDQ
ncbi:MAG: right-handed parallel beta-helix repeat-containing protein [Ignavibacteriaceae bacterium]